MPLYHHFSACLHSRRAVQTWTHTSAITRIFLFADFLFKGGVTLGNVSCNFSQRIKSCVAALLYCAMILATCLATATTEDSRESVERFKGVTSQGFCCFRSILCYYHCFSSAFTHTQNAPVKLRGRYQVNFIRESFACYFSG